MDGKTCGSCNFYLRHYALKNGQLFRVYCGHCTRPRVRRKQPDTTACEYYQAGEMDTEAFVTKEYLSKELLHHVLNMELLPDIKEYSEDDVDIGD